MKPRSLATYFRRGLILVLASAIAVMSSCNNKKHSTLFLAAGLTNLNISLDYPRNPSTGAIETFNDVCQDAQALLVSLDLNSAATLSWQYRFLMGLDGSLWGCSSSAPCSGNSSVQNLPRPYRIAVEGIDVAPQDYPNSATHNVICRGVADITVGMGTIVAVAAPTPSPQASQPANSTSLKITAVVPMLRIGDVNPTWNTVAPLDREQGVLLVPPSTILGRTATGGLAVFGAGATTTNIYEFDPRSIAMVQTPTFLSQVRPGAIVLSIRDSSGTPAVIFAGGADTTGDSLPDSFPSLELYRHGVAETSVWPGLLTPLNDGAVYLPNHVEASTSTPAAVFLGGCHVHFTPPSTYDLQFQADYQFFFPAAPEDTSSCLPGTVPGSPGFCVPGSGLGMGDGGHCQGIFSSLSVGGVTQAVVGMGIVIDGVAGIPFKASRSTYAFDPETKTFVAFENSAGVNVDTLPNTDTATGTASAVLSSNVIGLFGGAGLPTATSSSNWGLVRSSDLTVHLAPTVMEQTHFLSLAVQTLDERVFLIGGNDAYSASLGIEVFTPGALALTNGTFGYLSRSLSSACSGQGTGSGCVHLENSGITAAVLILGSRTWINGSIVVAGGNAAAHSTGLIIPAYQCNGTTPVNTGSPIPVQDIDFCDRGRSSLPITNPATGVALQ